jgi:hypothetical protein
MDLDQVKEEVRAILFQIGKDVDIHKLGDGNLIIDINYEKYVNQIVSLITEDEK